MGSRALRTVTAVVALATVALVEPTGTAAGEADTTTTTSWTARPLDVAERVQGGRAASSRLARSDDDLLARTDATPVPVLIKLDYDALASYAGDIEDVPATSPVVTGRPLGAAASTGVYARLVEGREAEIVAALTAAVPEIRVDRRLRTVYGGLAATLPARAARTLLDVPGVVAVQSDDLRSTLRAGAAPPPGGSVESAAGQGVLIGTIDTGLDPDDAALAPRGTDVGVPRPGGQPSACDFGDDPVTAGPQIPTCDGRVAAGRAVLDRYLSVPGVPDAATGGSARDGTGHGTALAAALVSRAPGAHLAAYRACGALGCFASDLAAAVGASVTDGVDVLALALTAEIDPRTDPVALALLDATGAGTSVVSGPDASAAPWIEAAAAGAADPTTAVAARAAAVATVRATHPEWTTSEVRSALTTTRRAGLEPDLAAALDPGLVLDQPPHRMFALAGRAATAVHLNAPTITAADVDGPVTTRRTVTNVSDGPANYRVETTASDGATIRVSPNRFTVAEGATRTLTITIRAGPGAERVDGHLRLEAPDRPGLRLPVSLTTAPARVTVESDCDATTVAVGGIITCRVRATNDSAGATTVSGTTTVGSQLDVDSAGEPASTASPRLVTLGATALAGRTPSTPRLEPLGFEGYVPLDELGIAPVPVGDEEALNIDLDVPFRFGDVSYRRIGVTTDGYLVAGGVNGIEDIACCPGGDDPDPAAPNGVIAPFWTDLTGEDAPGVFVASVSDGTATWVVVEWRVSPVGDDSEKVFQAWLGTGGTQDVALAYPADDPPDRTGLASPLLVGAEAEDGRSGDLRADAAATPDAGEPATDLLITRTGAAPAHSVTYTVGLIAKAGGVARVRTALGPVGASGQETSTETVTVVGPGPGEVEAFVDEAADAVLGPGVDPMRRADWVRRIRAGTLTPEGFVRELARRAGTG